MTCIIHFIVMSYSGSCATTTRGEAAEDREHYYMPKDDRDTCNGVVHCTNNDSDCSKSDAYHDLDRSTWTVKSTWDS